ncbi:hypothetical protein A1OS_20960 [Enterovibrio norvegicus]|uniref:hypothetical protein n=1 Tax=Enterovibrio norvegicus TaxID=188144 RepID=UPI0002D5D8E7|nr:hypothetical protein [Enterovibrio norvegicus]OEE59350.1 hypothetical protein A1OS_20960 [Enterovibrio norvegicus]
MLKRRFYRLDEISDVTPLTKGDLLNAIERGELQLCAWIDVKSLGVVDTKSKGASLGNLFDYRGIIGLSPESSVKSVQSEKTKLDLVYIFEPEFVVNWRDASKAYPKANYSRFNKLSTSSEQPQKPFFAFASIGTKTVFGERIKNIVKAGAEEQRNVGVEGFINAMLETEQELVRLPIEIEKDQLRFDLALVNKVFGLETVNKERQNSTSDNPSASQSRGRRNRVLDVIERALKAHPQGDYHAIHKLIRDEHNEHENKADFSAKTYDIDEVIQSIDSDVITWRTKSGDVKEMSRKYFEDSISNIRKELGYSKR